MLRYGLLGYQWIRQRKGKQHTFVLLDEWIPDQRKLNREETLEELTRRYFRSRGPATVFYDFPWWSGLTVKEARQGIAMVATDLKKRSTEGQDFWFSDGIEEKEARSQTVHLLPAF